MSKCQLFKKRKATNIYVFPTYENQTKILYLPETHLCISNNNKQLNWIIKEKPRFKLYEY